MKDRIIEATVDSVKKIRLTRYFKSERGYQGVLFCHLFNILEQLDLINEDRILEQEYQKSSRHGMGQRPDIIFHIPVEHSGLEIDQNNYAVWALKANTSKDAALIDFDKLEEMFYHLKYPLGFFINIDSEENFLDSYEGKHHDKIIGLSVKLNGNDVRIKKSWFENEQIMNLEI